jgi:GT2 family glycosyltransferase
MPKSPKVIIGLILFKGEHYLKYSLPSLVNQDYPDTEYLFRDQSPNGEAFGYIKKELPDVFSKIQIEKGSNLWHSGGHNALMREMIRHGGDYYFCCSNDMLYPADFVSKIIAVMEDDGNNGFGSATCKLMKWDFEKAEKGDIEASKTNVIDSYGIGLTKGHHFFDIGQGESDHAAYSARKDIFGPSGALAVYRKKALDDIAFTNDKGEKEYFDELLHYKNDVDLSYRLQWAGYSSLFIPETRVYHDRQVGAKINVRISIATLKEHARKSEWVKVNSLFGHLVTVKKNFTKNYSFEVRFRTWINGIIRFAHTLIFNPGLLKQYALVRKIKSVINKKREAIIRKKEPGEIEKLMT